MSYPYMTDRLVEAIQELRDYLEPEVSRPQSCRTTSKGLQSAKAVTKSDLVFCSRPLLSSMMTSH